jgi:hypothetical protein
MTKMKRYHKDVFYPSWAEKSAQHFFDELSKKRTVVFSTHALAKILADSFKYGQNYSRFLFKSLDNAIFDFHSLFEFYAVDDNIRKGCLRFSHHGLPVDIIVVVSAEGVVITSFTINKDDTHASLNKNLYEKG